MASYPDIMSLYSAHQQYWKYSNKIIDTLIHAEHFINLFFKKLVRTSQQFEYN